jgi:hypothetical protein
VLWVLCDYYEMLAFLIEVMGVIDCKVCVLVIDLVRFVFYDDCF